jgi:HAE1 family hydrophobic/amphiphilic exporter-1
MAVVLTVLAIGAGMQSCRGVGTAEFGGMLAAALIGIFLIPVLYVIVQGLREWVPGKAAAGVRQDVHLHEPAAPADLDTI